MPIEYTLVIVNYDGIGFPREQLLNEVETLKKLISKGHRTIRFMVNEEEGFDSIDVIERGIKRNLIAFIEMHFSLTDVRFKHSKRYKYISRPDGGVNIINQK